MPELELDLIEDQSERLLDQLEASKIDIAVLTLPFNLRNLKCLRFAE